MVVLDQFMEHLLKESCCLSSTPEEEKVEDEEVSSSEDGEVEDSSSERTWSTDQILQSAIETSIIGGSATPMIISDNAVSHFHSTNRQDQAIFERRIISRKEQQSISRWQSTSPPVVTSSSSSRHSPVSSCTSSSPAIGGRRISGSPDVPIIPPQQGRRGMNSSPICPVRKPFSSSSPSLDKCKSLDEDGGDDANTTFSSRVGPVIPLLSCMSLFDDEENKTSRKNKNKKDPKQEKPAVGGFSIGNTTCHLLPRSDAVTELLVRQHAEYQHRPTHTTNTTATSMIITEQEGHEQDEEALHQRRSRKRRSTRSTTKTTDENEVPVLRLQQKRKATATATHTRCVLSSGSACPTPCNS